jgi:hypothetical protein
VHPAAGSEDERRYFRYAVARLGPFANITWDLGDDLDRFRSEVWTHEMGTMPAIKSDAEASGLQRRPTLIFLS